MECQRGDSGEEDVGESSGGESGGIGASGGGVTGMGCCWRIRRRRVWFKEYLGTIPQKRVNLEG